MKIKSQLLYIALLVGILFVSCKNDDDDDTGNSDNAYVNDWIYEKMSEYYLWNEQIPSKKSVDFNKNPMDFFDNLLIKYEKYDGNRGYNFSYIESTHLNLPKSAVMEDNQSESVFDIGFDYIPIWADNSQTNVNFVITYVKNDLNNDTNTKLKRGNEIYKVDGMTITEANYRDILKKYKPEYELEFIDYETKQLKKATIKTAFNYTENPVFLDSVYTEGSHKIGYLVYNFFAFGTQSKREFDVDLVQRLTRFDREEITDLILDLRYNPGGYNISAQVLASALVPQRKTEQTKDNLFEIKKYNDALQSRLNALPDNDPTKISYMYLYLIDNITSGRTNLQSIPRLGDRIKNLYIITSGYTASASELTINCLKAFRTDITLVGEKTVGKNVGMSAFYEDNDSKNQYVMWPVTFRSYNKNETSEYGDGFKPGIAAYDLMMLEEGMKPLGDKNETMLKAAINGIIKGEKSSVKSTPPTVKKLPGASLEQRYTAYKMIDERNINQFESLSDK